MFVITSEADKHSGISTTLAIFRTDSYYLNNKVAVTWPKMYVFFRGFCSHFHGANVYLKRQICLASVCPWRPVSHHLNCSFFNIERPPAPWGWYPNTASEDWDEPALRAWGILIPALVHSMRSSLSSLSRIPCRGHIFVPRSVLIYLHIRYALQSIVNFLKVHTDWLVISWIWIFLLSSAGKWWGCWQFCCIFVDRKKFLFFIYYQFYQVK